MNDPADTEDADLAALRAHRCPDGTDYVGLAGAIVPFFVSFRDSHTETATVDTAGGPEVTSHTSFKDYVAIGGGGLAIVVALVTFSYWRMTPRGKLGLRIALTIGILLLGLYQLLLRGGVLT